MAVPTSTFQTYQAIGNREDLIDVVTNIAPVETFVTSSTGSTRAKARLHEWQTDTLAAAAANAVIEGDDATNTAVTPTTRLTNSTQILRKVFQVSDTQEAVDAAGRSSEIDYQTAKFSKELAKDIEYALLINASEVTGASGTARQMKGILGFIATNVTTATATSETLTEARLNDNLGLIWAQGGTPTVTLVGSKNKRYISAFTSNTRDISADRRMLVNAVDVYQSDFGTVQVRLHHQLNTTAPGTVVNLGSMDLWWKAWLRPIMREPLARTGSSKKYMMEAELTLESREEKGSGKMTGFNVA